jgi:glycine hydroxymethyltransferase
VSAALLTAPLQELDPEVAELLEAELRRQRDTLDAIASESVAPLAVLQCLGSVLTNKYASGYLGSRHYLGCEQVDVIERLAIARARALFGAEHANVQPYSGAQANIAVYDALLTPGDRMMGLALDHGGHFTHGGDGHESSRLYEVVRYGVDPVTRLLDMEEVARIARATRPRLIVAGGSCYPRRLDFPALRRIANEVGAYLMVDMAHVAGFVAARLHPSPVPHADVVTTTMHKTLGGPRAGLILCSAAHAQAIDRALYPGRQGGPLPHAIAATAVALALAAGPAFRAWMERTLAGARTLAATIAGDDVEIWSGGTDVHFAIVDLRRAPIDGVTAERRLGQVGIVANRAVVPFDPRPLATPSGLRVGAPTLAARGFDEQDFAEAGRLVRTALGPDFERRRPELRRAVAALAARRPLYATA